jgi:hypothetical protein
MVFSIIYLFIPPRLTSVSDEGYVDKKYMYAKTKNQKLKIIKSKQTQKQRKAKNNPPPSAVGFTHSGDDAPW